MQKLLTTVLVLTFLTDTVIITSNVNSALAGQVIAASASITVAVVGFWALFKKPKPQRSKPVKKSLR